MIYKNEVEATYIPPNWYSWIHFTNNELNDPSIIEKKYSWEKKHQPNLSGTKKAYRPKKIIENKKIPKKYETWKN